MKRLLALVLDRGLFGAVRDRAVLSVVAFGCGGIGILLLVAAGFDVAVRAIGLLPTLLAFSAGFLVIALITSMIASYRWRHRPRPLLTAAKLAFITESLAVARGLIAKDPAKLLLAALILGAISEHLDRRDKD